MNNEGLNNSILRRILVMNIESGLLALVYIEYDTVQALDTILILHSNEFTLT